MDGGETVLVRKSRPYFHGVGTDAKGSAASVSGGVAGEGVFHLQFGNGRGGTENASVSEALSSVCGAARRLQTFSVCFACVTKLYFGALGKSCGLSPVTSTYC